MPQHPLPIQPSAPDAAMHLELRDLTLDLEDALLITVRLERLDRPPETFGVIRLDGAVSGSAGEVMAALAASWVHGTRETLLVAIQTSQRRARRDFAKMSRTGRA